MNNNKTWWQRLFLGLGILTFSTAPLSGGEAAAAPSRYGTAMVELLGELHDYAHKRNPHFQLLANGGSSLYLPIDGNTSENVGKMLQAVDGQLAESVYYGFNMEDGAPTPPEENAFFLQTLDAAREGGLPIFVLDYVKDADQAAQASKKSLAKGYIPLATPYRNLDHLPPYPASPIHNQDVTCLNDVKNYMILLTPDKFSSPADYLASLQATDYDMLIIDLYAGSDFLTPAEVEKLKYKANGGRRLVLAYMSVGEAETYRKYWQSTWKKEPPVWLDNPNADWQDNYRVKFWLPGWKHILYGSPHSYLDEILAAGFDGAFLDVIDVYQYFQAQET
ncbi:MAG: endo alpha-1,4 polygalactosaminidase [Selenomonas sp.]|uniref:endo alpha-1,4 polygalactosaminidase n=1 Tax=Selenomonas sp. TaxID=2053611 RepID=UPI0025D0923A|nr:endo alpha-1,4 polygalactosaminidase [Selenomonas sp.]MCR5756944.1 endo alpha-1,4 polygalactosaminidase [Selenomonas sp.]